MLVIGKSFFTLWFIVGDTLPQERQMTLDGHKDLVSCSSLADSVPLGGPYPLWVSFSLLK